MFSFLATPLFRKLLIVSVFCAVGFYVGYSWRTSRIQQLRKDKNIASGKFQSLSKSYSSLKVVNDTLLNVVINLAKQERIKVDNYITDTKLKDGSELNFIPKTHAKLTTNNLEPYQLKQLETPLPTTTNTPPIQPSKPKKDTWLRRLFTRRKI